ncbi:optic atrophy 3 protein-domain-containing protein [Cantharellus anzutake]|uniref:optic atrophy 3 protein-domain-containing protein n=1 Tax=Cantharellus anzutake TaxID=1750568 RepID=UPI0019064A2B|nr:optic atrophy 3 protein-domain-containing protein [Cantharellus anzutake]KAF8331931.1 optic atrophy 3 protein-domain-containing protein [Cantharellus anzutake]
MASVKLATLAIRTIAKPIANSLKSQAEQHPTFRRLCIGLAQWSHRSEVRLRTGLLGESAKNIRPLNDVRAIQNGANTLAEGFLFAVTAGLILGESYRSSRKEETRRDAVNDKIEYLQQRLEVTSTRLDSVLEEVRTCLDEEKQQNEDISRILSRIVDIGLKGGE